MKNNNKYGFKYEDFGFRHKEFGYIRLKRK